MVKRQSSHAKVDEEVVVKVAALTVGGSTGDSEVERFNRRLWCWKVMFAHQLDPLATSGVVCRGGRFLGQRPHLVCYRFRFSPFSFTRKPNVDIAGYLAVLKPCSNRTTSDPERNACVG